MQVMVLEGRNLASPVHCQKGIFCSERHEPFFNAFFCAFVFVFFSIMVDEKLNVKETNPEQISES